MWGLVTGALYGTGQRVVAAEWNTFKKNRTNIWKRWLLFGADILIAAVSLIGASGIRFGIHAPAIAYAPILATLPLFLLCAAVAFPVSGLYNRHWKYASLQDLLMLFKAAGLTIAIYFAVLFLRPAPETVQPSIILTALVLMVCLLAGLRLSIRIGFAGSLLKVVNPFARGNGMDRVPVLLAGPDSATDQYLRSLERDPNAMHWPVGVLDNEPEYHGLKIRNVPILGGFDDLQKVVKRLERRGRRPAHIILTQAVKRQERENLAKLVDEASMIELSVMQVAAPTELLSAEAGDKIRVRPIELGDLLLRPQVRLETSIMARQISGKRVLITGAGGSIGSELTKQVAAFAPAQIILIDNCEYNLYAIDMDLKAAFPEVKRHPYICNIRESERVELIFERHRPEMVFHAAALKHVPMVEANPEQGILTNAIGSMVVADAAQKYRANAMVQVSTDKAVNSTSVMGASKRLAELYCQALDLKNAGRANAPRFMTVRFGNVLGSSGSLIPLFRKQLETGGPLTVTHPDMERFFMTIREAVQLTLHASATGLEKQTRRGEILVLDMGDPVKVMDIARRMIRLAGFVPDRDIKIDIIGLRPGEKLFEELFDADEDKVPVPISGVLGAMPQPLPLDILKREFFALHRFAVRGETARVYSVIRKLLPKYSPHGVTIQPAAVAERLRASTPGQRRLAIKSPTTRRRRVQIISKDMLSS